MGCNKPWIWPCVSKGNNILVCVCIFMCMPACGLHTRERMYQKFVQHYILSKGLGFHWQAKGLWYCWTFRGAFVRARRITVIPKSHPNFVKLRLLHRLVFVKAVLTWPWKACVQTYKKTVDILVSTLKLQTCSLTPPTSLLWNSRLRVKVKCSCFMREYII